MKQLNFKFCFGIFILSGILLFSCEKDKTTNTVTDANTNTYKRVRIGDQIWMAENLRTTVFNDRGFYSKY